MVAMLRRAGWIFACVVALALVGALARVGFSGSLEPDGPPASSMQSLDDVLPGWHLNLSAAGTDPCNSERFRCVLSGEGVLDRETGLVWERVPSTTTVFSYGAFNTCIGKTIGGESGWRLPRIEELMSLRALGQTSPALPLGHPFDLGVLEEEAFWSATIDWGNTLRTWDFYMFNGSAASLPHETPGVYALCVRGPGGVR